jgi:hypothetical protein
LFLLQPSFRFERAHGAMGVVGAAVDNHFLDIAASAWTMAATNRPRGQKASPSFMAMTLGCSAFDPLMAFHSKAASNGTIQRLRV